MYKNYVVLISSDQPLSPKDLSSFEKQINDSLELVNLYLQ